MASSRLLESEGEHTSDEDFSPGHLVIDMEEVGDPLLDHTHTSTRSADTMNNEPEYRQSILRSTEEAPQLVTPAVNQGVQPGDDFKGLTFVGKMDVNQPPDVFDTLCLYSYHWGPTHIDIITRRSGQSLVPVKNVYGRVVPGLTRNAISNRIPKIGAKTIALPETHINTLKKLQLPITARSHYLLIEDFIRLCCYYKKTPPSNLSHFITVNASNNPAEVLQLLNSQKPPQPPPPLPGTSSALSMVQSSPLNGVIKTESLFDQSDFTMLSPGQINANLASSMGEVLQYATPYPLWNSHPSPITPQTPPASTSNTKSSADHARSPTAGAEFHSLVLPDGTQIALVIQNSTPYLLNAELQHLLPQANQNVIGPLRSLLNIPLEYASRPNMNALKEVGVIGIKACRSIVYKVCDVIKMYRHFKVAIPRFLHDLNDGKIPRGVVDMTPMSSLQSLQPPPATPISTDMMSPSGVRINLGAAAATASPKPNERRNSHSGVSPLDDQSVEYEYLPWGTTDKIITLLKQPTGEPYVAIAELVDKIFAQRSQISLQKRTRLGVSTLPATSLQIHALRARGSIDPSSGYSKLISLSGVLILAKEAGIFIPSNVYDECQKYSNVPLDTLLNRPTPSFMPPPDGDMDNGGPSSETLPPSFRTSTTLHDKPSMSLPLLKDEIKNHPDVILPAKLGLRSADGILYQIVWGGAKIVIFTSAKRINYVGLYQIYDVLFKNLVSRMNFKMRMRKLGIKSIRAPPSIRVSLIKLGALPTSSPVCGLLKISEMDRLVRSYNMPPPKVFEDLFLNKSNEDLLESSPDDFKDFCNPPGSKKSIPSLPSFDVLPLPPPSPLNTLQRPYQHSFELVPHLSSSDGFKGRPDDSLVVSLPRALVSVQYPGSQIIPSPNSKTKPQSQPQLSQVEPSIEHVPRPTISRTSYSHNNNASTFTNRGSILQKLAKKISQKNHKLAASSMTSSARECPSCKRLYPVAKKRCEACNIYLVGRPCPSCGTINYSRCVQCTTCGWSLDPSKRSKESESASQVRIITSARNQSNDTPTYYNEAGGKSSDISDTDSTSPVQSLFSAPPIRSTVLKKMFPDQKNATNNTTNNGGGVVTKTLYTGTVGSTRRCLECDTINSKMGKKCHQCKAPLQGRPCLQCSRPNHSHSTECYKCGAPLPSTATKWVVGGRIVRTSGESSGVSGMTSAELNKEVSRRAPINCMRCERMKQKGRFKCGRCGDLYLLSPLLDSTGKVIKRKRNEHTHNSSSKDMAAEIASDELMASLPFNLQLLGIGVELEPVLTKKEQEFWELLTPAEQELADIEEQYQEMAKQKEEKEMMLSDIQADLNALIIRIEKASKQLTDYAKTEDEAMEVSETYPTTIKTLEDRLSAIDQLL